MKKFAIIAILAATAMTASAAEVGIHTSRSTNAGIDAVGVSIGESFGAVGVEAAYDRSTTNNVNVHRYSLVGSYDVIKLADVTFSAKAGAAFIDPSIGQNGAAATVGIGASYPLTKNVRLVADYSYQRGQSRVSQYNGNTLSAGVKYLF